MTTPIHYHINENTEIKNLKNIILHISTKAEFTEYQSDQLISYEQGKSQKLGNHASPNNESQFVPV